MLIKKNRLEGDMFWKKEENKNARQEKINYTSQIISAPLRRDPMMSLLAPSSCRSRNTSRLRSYRVNNRSRSWAKVLMASRVAGDGIFLAPTANRSLLLPPSHRHRPPFDVVEAVSGSSIDVNQHDTVRPGYFIPSAEIERWNSERIAI